MNENRLTARMSIDLKRYRFRITKDTLDRLGDPKYVQFLVSKEELCVMVLGLDKPVLGAAANKIVIDLGGKNCKEFSSAVLLDEILKIFGNLDFRLSYQISGEIDQTNRVAYFYLNTVKRIDGRQTDDRKGL